MKILEVKTALKDYPIYIDHSYDELVSAFEKSGLKPSKLCIITPLSCFFCRTKATR